MLRSVAAPCPADDDGNTATMWWRSLRANKSGRDEETNL